MARYNHSLQVNAIIMALKYSPTIGTEHVVLIFLTQYITSLTVWPHENILNYSLRDLSLKLAQ